jgi:hypothetical protein
MTTIDGTNDRTELEFVRYYEDYKKKKNLKSGADFQIGRLNFNGETSVIAFLADQDNQAIGVFTEHHPNAKFTSGKPDGLRLLGAIARHYAIKGEIQDVVDHHNEQIGEGSLTLNICKTEKGVLWSIKEDA